MIVRLIVCDSHACATRQPYDVLRGAVYHTACPASRWVRGVNGDRVVGIALTRGTTRRNAPSVADVEPPELDCVPLVITEPVAAPLLPDVGAVAVTRSGRRHCGSGRRRCRGDAGRHCRRCCGRRDGWHRRGRRGGWGGGRATLVAVRSLARGVDHRAGARLVGVETRLALRDSAARSDRIAASALCVTLTSIALKRPPSVPSVSLLIRCALP